MEIFLMGAVAMSCLVAALFFFRFYWETKDFLFLMFSISFLVESINRTALGAMRLHGEGDPGIYLIRLLSYLLILAGIISKNLKRS